MGRSRACSPWASWPCSSRPPSSSSMPSTTAGWHRGSGCSAVSRRRHRRGVVRRAPRDRRNAPLRARADRRRRWSRLPGGVGRRGSLRHDPAASRDDGDRGRDGSARVARAAPRCRAARALGAGGRLRRAPAPSPRPTRDPNRCSAYTALVATPRGALAMHAHLRRAIGLAAAGYFLLTARHRTRRHAHRTGIRLHRAGRDDGAARPPGASVARVALRHADLRLGPPHARGDRCPRSRALGRPSWRAAALLGATWWDARMDGRYHEIEPRPVDAYGAMFFAAPAAFCAVTAIARAQRAGDLARAGHHRRAALYLLTGWRGRWLLFVAAGLALVAVAAAQQWHGSMLVGEWSALVLLAVLIDRMATSTPARPSRCCWAPSACRCSCRDSARTGGTRRSPDRGRGRCMSTASC